MYVDYGDFLSSNASLIVYVCTRMYVCSHTDIHVCMHVFICDRICEKGAHPANIKNRISHTQLLYIDRRTYPESFDRVPTAR